MNTENTESNTPETRIPLIGEDAPAFNSATTMGPINFPADYAGKWTVLFSHPGDFTPVCTTEFMAFQDQKAEFDKRDTELLGYSIDGLHSHIAWVKNIKENFDVDIEFPIVADLSVAYKYGMLHPTANSNQTVRAVFVISPEGKIAAIMYYPLSNGRNVDEIIRLIDSLQMSANNGRATPANWPNNKIFGDDVIVPPASTMDMADENQKNFDNKDWYICSTKNPNK
ncbi:peroxiredoxin [Candidatus Gracilibacteria bacterium]|nr:peroxiredoxin [Candidatus Gracilibacteria bacterium]